MRFRSRVAARSRDKESAVRIREIALDMGWLLVLVLLIPLAIPLFVIAFIFLLGQRLYSGARHRWQPA
jgi:hypothetical protein